MHNTRITRRGLLSLALPALAQTTRTVVLTFDDSAVTHATTVAPLLKKYGFNGTFFVCEFPPDFDDKSKYMSWEQIAELHRAGFEIGSHTRTHKHVNKMTREEFHGELAYIEDKCKAQGITRPDTFAYPAYDTHPMALEVLKERGYRYARVGGNRPWTAKDDPLLIPSFSSTGTDKERVLRVLDRANGGDTVVLTVHGVPDYAHDWVTTPPGLFEEYLRYMRDQGIRGISFRQFRQG